MKSKLALVCVTVVVCATWWTGCGGTSDSTPSTTDAGGSSEGGSNEGGSDAGGGTDAAADAKLDTTITGPFVALTYGTCVALAKCESSPIGTWKITGGCVSDTVFDTLKTQSMCPTLTISDVKFEARGVVSANAVQIASSAELKFAAKAFIPESCKQGAFTCPQIGTALVSVGGLKTATCADSTGTAAGCDCSVTGETKNTQTADSYKTAAGVLTTGGGRTYDYCATGSLLKYRETTNGTQVPATLELTK